MPYSWKIIAITVFLASLLSACAGMGRSARLHDLQDALQDYAAALRWERYSDAYDFIRARDGSRPDYNMEGFDNYRVADVVIVRSDLNDEETEALTYVVIRYYKITSGTIQELKQAQDWWYEPEAERWFLEGDLPYPGKIESE